MTLMALSLADLKRKCGAGGLNFSVGENERSLEENILHLNIAHFGWVCPPPFYQGLISLW